MELLSFLRTHWDRLGGWSAIVAGAIVITVGWVGVSGTPYVFEQLPYILSAGIGGLFLLGVGATLLLSADLRDEWRKLDAIEEHLARGASPNGAGTAIDSDPAAATADPRPPTEATSQRLAPAVKLVSLGGQE